MGEDEKVLYANHKNIPGEPDTKYFHDFDQMYGSTQKLVGETVLISEDKSLSEDINRLNENIYRTQWHHLSILDTNKEMEEIKMEAWDIVERMREDIKRNTRLEWSDIIHISSGFWGK